MQGMGLAGWDAHARSVRSGLRRCVLLVWILTTTTPRSGKATSDGIRSRRTRDVRVRIALAVARGQAGVGWWGLMVSTTATTTTTTPLPSLVSCLAMA